MARQPQVTRTITTTLANVLCLNIEKQEPFNQIVKIPRTYKSEKDMLKTVEKLVNTDTIKAVHIVSTETQETLYGMSEQKFIELADILPPRKGATDTNENSETDTSENIESESAN